MSKIILDKIKKAMELAAAWYNVPIEIVQAVAWQESGWGQLGDDTRMRSFDGGHGKGIMQIDDRFHDIAKNDSIFDIFLNICYGTRLLRLLYNQYATWPRAIKYYNGMGEAAEKYMELVLGHIKHKPWGDA